MLSNNLNINISSKKLNIDYTKFLSYINWNNFITSSIVELCLLLLILNFFLIIIIKSNKFNNFLKKILNFINYLSYIFLTILSFFKFLNTIKLNNSLDNYWFYSLKLKNNQKLWSNGFCSYLFYNNTVLGDCLIFLSFFIGFICLCILGFKSVTYKLQNILLFSVFGLLTTIMCSTDNLLIMFIMFELLFLPTIYYVYKLTYSKKSDKSINYLVYWTLFGSFCCAMAIMYIYSVTETLNYTKLLSFNFSNLEKNTLYVLFLFGFGVKMPLVPFSSWLLKIHVESSVGFSIFLSGFLVKTAVYCFYICSFFFQTEGNKFLTLCFVILTIYESSINMWTQVDLKKLIAWATIQEMALIVAFLIIGNQQICYLSTIFILMHGILSAIMFFLVEIISNKIQTRSLLELQGLGSYFNDIKLYIWMQLIVFLGFPLTVKFLIEVQVLIIMWNAGPSICIFICIVLSVFGGIGFFKNMISIMYGIRPRTNEKISNKYALDYVTNTPYQDIDNPSYTNRYMSKSQKNILNSLVILLIFINFLVFLL